jgi:uncharacterized RDD family membrane protein YckC
MSTIRIQTTQHTELEYTLAGLGDRITAYLIDLLIYAAYITIIVTLIFSNWVGSDSYEIILLFIPVLFYQLLCEIFMNGQSVGKRIRSIRVISLDGNQPGLGQYMIRWIFRILDDMIGSGVVAIVSIALTPKAQRIGDILAGTTVVRTRSATVFEDTIFIEADATYEPLFPQVIRLKDRDLGMLKEVVKRVRRDPEAHQALLEKACLKTKEVLGVDSDLPQIEFLETVVRDYNHITSLEKKG